MSLLTALVALVPTALVARPRNELVPEPVPDELAQAREALADSSRLLVEVHASLVATRERRDLACRRVAELVDDNLRLMDENARLRYPNVPPDLKVFHNPQQNAQASQNPFHNAMLNEGMVMLGLAHEWPHCTCVPGRYDALRRQFPKVFDGA